MNEELKKALDALIEETITEIEDLKKSRFAASEIKIEGPGSDGIAGKPKDGSIEKEEDEDDEKEEDEDEKDMDKAEDAEKSEGKNKEADPGPVHHGEGKDKGAGPREQSGGGKVRGSEGVNSKADPGEIHKADDKKADKDEPHKDDPKHEDKEKKAIKKLASMHDMDKADMGYMKGAIAKSQDEVSSLMKSYIDERVTPLEQKLSSILDLVNKIADQPVAPKGVTARMQPLTKSADEGKEPLSKAELGSKLFELKKSGTAVESLDIAKAELGQDLQLIAKKYNLA